MSGAALGIAGPRGDRGRSQPRADVCQSFAAHQYRPARCPHLLLTLIATNAVIVDAPALPARLVRDIDDDKFVAAALAAEAAVIVTGDKELHALVRPQRLVILTPRQVADQHLREG